jgi:hypothetical protein
METPDNVRFEIENILPGIYDLFATLPDIHGGDSISLPGAPKVAFGRAIINARENVSGATINIHPGVDLNGRVTIDGRPAAPSGLMVHLQPDAQAAKLTHYQNVSRYRPVIGVDGTFRFPVLPEAQYGIAVDGFEDSSLTLADILLDGKSVKLSGVSIGATPPGLLEIVLKRSGNGQ